MLNVDGEHGEDMTDLNGEDGGRIEGFPNGRTPAFGRVSLPFDQIFLVLHHVALLLPNCCYQ